MKVHFSSNLQLSGDRSLIAQKSPKAKFQRPHHPLASTLHTLLCFLTSSIHQQTRNQPAFCARTTLPCRRSSRGLLEAALARPVGNSSPLPCLPAQKAFKEHTMHVRGVSAGMYPADLQYLRNLGQYMAVGTCPTTSMAQHAPTHPSSHHSLTVATSCLLCRSPGRRVPAQLPVPSPCQEQQPARGSSVIAGSGLEGFLSLSALLKPEIAAVFSAVVAGAGAFDGGLSG